MHRSPFLTVLICALSILQAWSQESAPAAKAPEKAGEKQEAKDAQADSDDPFSEAGMQRKRDAWRNSISGQLMREYDKQLAEARARYRKVLADHLAKATRIKIYRLEADLTEAKQFKAGAGWPAEEEKMPDDHFLIPGSDLWVRILESKTITDADQVARLAGELGKAAVKEQDGVETLGHFPDHGLSVYVNDECILSTSICWEAGAWLIEYPDYERRSEHLDTTKELEAICRELLPVPAAPKERISH